MPSGADRFRAATTLVWREEDGRRSPLKGRTVMMVILYAALATPLMASADGQMIPPEANRTPTPPARSTVDVNRLASVLVDKSLITPREYRQLTQPQGSSPSPHRRGRGWTWDDIDRNPARSTGGE
jgi:hypothetical protein